MKPIKDLPIAVAFVKRGKEILLLQRQDKNPAWDKKWEFPGGKIDSEENAVDAIIREIKEETGLNVSAIELIGNHIHDWDIYDDKILRVHLHCFSCQAQEGEIILEDEKAYTYVWANPKKALELDLLEANADIIKKFLIKS